MLSRILLASVRVPFRICWLFFFDTFQNSHLAWTLYVHHGGSGRTLVLFHPLIHWDSVSHSLIAVPFLFWSPMFCSAHSSCYICLFIVWASFLAMWVGLCLESLQMDGFQLSSWCDALTSMHVVTLLSYLLDETKHYSLISRFKFTRLHFLLQA